MNLMTIAMETAITIRQQANRLIAIVQLLI
jgi:hypothetical protein